MPRMLEIAFSSFQISHFSAGEYPFSGHSHLLLLQWLLVTNVIETPALLTLASNLRQLSWWFEHYDFLQFSHGHQSKKLPLVRPSETSTLLCSYQCYAWGGGGARDRVGTLNVRVRPTWGILTNFDRKCWPRERKF